MKKTLSQTAIYALGIALGKGVGLLLVPIYTRQAQLPPAEVAIWDLCTTTVLFLLAVTELGMASALARFHIQADTEHERRALGRSAMAVVLMMSGVLCALVLPFRQVLAEVILTAPDRGHVIVLIAIITALTALGNLPLALLRAQEWSVAFSALCLARAVAGSVAALVLVIGRGMGVEGILIGEATGLAVLLAAGGWICRSHLVPRLDADASKRLLAFGVPIVPIGLATAVVLVSDRYFLRAYAGLDQLALYTIGFKASMAMALAAQALQTAWAPSAFHIAKQPGAPQELARSFRLLCVGLCTLALSLCAIAPELTALFGPSGLYPGAYRVVPWIAFSYAAQAALLVMTANLVIANRTLYATAVFCVGAGIKIGLNFLLIPSFGIDGAAAATLLAYLVEMAVAYPLSRAVYPVPYERGRIGLLFLFAAVAAICTQAATALPGIASLPLRAAIMAAFLALIVLAGVIGREELSAFLALIARPLRQLRRNASRIR